MEKGLSNNDIHLDQLYQQFSYNGLRQEPETISYKINKKFGNGSAKMISVKKGISYMIYDVFLKKDILVKAKENDYSGKIWLYLCLSGNGNFTFNKRESKILPGYSDFFTEGYDLSIKEMQKKDSRYQIVSFIFDQDIFTDLTGLSPLELFELSNRASFYQQKKMLPEMRNAALNIAMNNYPNVHQQLYIESKILEILSFKIGELMNFTTNLDLENIKRKSYVEKIEYAAEILEKNIIDPPGIFDLANLVDLNHNKLIKGFKEVFGHTPFEYLSKVRLKKSYELISSRRMNVTEAAFSVGYSSLSHFAKIFKKEFGINPSQFFKNIRA